MQNIKTDMPIRKRMILTSLIAGFIMTAQAQDAEIEKPKGKALMQVFGNFHTGFGKENNDRGFELERSYLGYEYQLSSGLSAKGVIDIGKSNDVSDYQRIVYIKNAMVSWEQGNLTLNGGLIPTTQFDQQERFWGYRYIMKSFQDLYNFGSSADLGISVAYKFADWGAVDAMIANGEGYKKVQINDGLNYGLGVTLTPIRNFQFRIYTGLNESGDKDKKDMVNVAAFAGYKCARFAIGAEYNFMLNAAYEDGADQYGYSVYASVGMSKVTDLYIRTDGLYSKKDWNKADDERTAIFGAQFKVGKYIRIAPNFRISRPMAHKMANRYSAYLNCYFGF